MFIPEYTVTNNIMRNISTAEYGKAIIENTTILSAWEQQLKKDSKVRFLYFASKLNGERTDQRLIKKYVDRISKNVPKQIVDTDNSEGLVNDLAKLSELEDTDIKNLHKEVSKNLPAHRQGVYRNRLIPNKVLPEEILAQMVELTDWYNSLDSKETHTILRAGILKAQIEHIQPFNTNNFLVASLATITALKSGGYGVNEYICLEDYYNRSGAAYDRFLSSASMDDLDLTIWLEFFTEAYAYEVTNAKEKILLLARDTKIAKATGRAKLSSRQERIVEYLQDYGILQNKDFGRLFPNISEDTVLRDLKKLIDKGIVEKRGSTKASRYELK